MSEIEWGGARRLLTPSILRNLLDYCPQTGLIRWRPRNAETHTNAIPRDILRWNNRFAGRPAINKLGNDGYLCGQVAKCFISAHAAAFVIHHGFWPTLEIDHKNRIKTDNRIDNLREVEAYINCHNRGYSDSRGVHYSKKDRKWRAVITVNGHRKHIGSFDNRETAIQARAAEERECGI